MSNMQTCLCNRKFYRIEHRNHNHSYFEKPKGGEHYSDYSGIVCMKCGWCFRSKAKWVFSCPDMTDKEYKQLLGNMLAPNLGHSKRRELYYTNDEERW